MPSPGLRSSASSRLRQGFRALVDLLCPHSADTDDIQTLTQARILVSSSIALIVIISLSGVLNEFIAAPNGLYRSRLEVGAALLLTSCCLAAFYKTGSVNLAGNIMLSGGFVVIVSACVSHGGFPSPTLPMFLALPVLSAFLMDRTMSVVWSIIALTSMLGLFTLSHLGYPFENPDSEDVFRTSLLVNLVIVNLINAATIAVYATVTQRLRLALDHQRARFEHMAGHDPLTDLPNRRMFDQQLDMALRRAERYKHRVAVAIVDLNGFKPINDTYGHRTGDLVLQELARRLQARLRATDTLARLGGDEFAFTLDHAGDRLGLEAVLDKVAREIARPMEIQGNRLAVQASIGMAIYPDDSDELEMLQDLADRAMYRAKSQSFPWMLAGDE